VTISPKPEKVLPASDPNRAVELIDSLIGKVPSFFPNSQTLTSFSLPQAVSATSTARVTKNHTSFQLPMPQNGRVEPFSRTDSITNIETLKPLIHRFLNLNLAGNQTESTIAFIECLNKSITTNFDETLTQRIAVKEN
jgi:hypothetical protein